MVQWSISGSRHTRLRYSVNRWGFVEGGGCGFQIWLHVKHYIGSMVVNWWFSRVYTMAYLNLVQLGGLELRRTWLQLRCRVVLNEFRLGDRSVGVAAVG